MRLNLILDRFSLISGLEPEKVSRWTPLCIDAKMQIEAMVKAGVDRDEEATVVRLSNCAAALAFYKYSLYAPDSNVESFTAGSVSIRLSETERERARGVWQEALESASDILDAPLEFSFRGVRI